ACFFVIFRCATKKRRRARALAMPRPMHRIARQSIHAIRFFSPSKALSMRLSRAEDHAVDADETSPRLVAARAHVTILGGFIRVDALPLQFSLPTKGLACTGDGKKLAAFSVAGRTLLYSFLLFFVAQRRNGDARER